MEPKPVITRRVFLQQTATALLFGGTVLACSSKNGDWCDQPQIKSDGNFPTKEESHPVERLSFHGHLESAPLH